MLALLALATLHSQSAGFKMLSLKNSAVAVVQRVDRQPLVSLQVFASALLAPESKRTHGVRHLLEHLMASNAGTLELDLEKSGGLLKAGTTRDTIQFEVTGPKEELPKMFALMRAVLREPIVTQEAMRKEAHVISEEKALSDNTARLGAAAWAAIYDEGGLDPMGDPKVMESLTPDDLAATYRDTITGPCLSAVLVGDVDVEPVSLMLRDLLQTIPASKSPPSEYRVARQPKRTEVEGYGEARGVPVGPFEEVNTVAAIVAGLGIASESDEAFFVYTPNATNGTVIVGRADVSSGFGVVLDGWIRPDFLQFYNRSRNLARAWFRRQTTTPSASASFFGALLSQDRTAQPEKFLEMVDAVTPDQFVVACEKFQKTRAAVVVGVP